MRLAIAASCLLLVSGVAAADPTPADAKAARAHFKAGEKLINQQRYDEAIKELEAAAQLDPRPEQFFNLGVAHHLRGDEPIAIEYYRLFLLDGPQGKQARDAAKYLVALEKKQAEVRQERVKKELAEVQARAAQGASATEAMVHAQYTADAETKEHQLTLINERIRGEEQERAEADAATKAAKAETARVLALSGRYEQRARTAPAGDGGGRRFLGGMLLAVGTGGITMGAHDLLARTPGLAIEDDADLHLGVGSASLVLGVILYIWGESEAHRPRDASYFERVQVVPNVTRQFGGVSLSTSF